jgi:hypothetical protein
MRYGCVLILTIIFSALNASGQDTAAFSESRIEMGLTTSFMHVGGSPSLNTTGFDIGSKYHFTSWLGYAGQVWFASGNNATIHDYLCGPEFTLRRRLSPFGHVLIGVAHRSAKFQNDTGFLSAVGGGLRLNISRRISFQVVEVDYAPTYLGGTRQNNVHISSGFSIGF